MDGALLMQYGQHDQLARAPENDMGSSLAMQLRQVLLQNQVHTNAEAVNYSYVPEAVAGDHGVFDEGVYLEPAPMQLDSGEADPLKDPVFNYISDMLMEEDTDDKTCMFIDCSGYRAVAKELTELISDSSSSGNSHSEDRYAVNSPGIDQPNKNVDLWINGLFKSDEFPGDTALESPASVNSSAATALPKKHPDCEVVPEEVFEERVHSFLDNIQDDIEKASRKRATPTSSTEYSLRKHEGPWAEDIPPGKSADHKQQATAINKKVDNMDLRSLLEECAQALTCEASNDNASDCPWSGDLLTTQNQIESGAIRNAVVDNKAIESEKEIRQELHSLLVECAQAVAGDDMTKAYRIVNGIRDKVSPHGNGTQRMGYYFAEALVARITGTGALLYSALSSNRPSATEMLKAYRLFTRYCPNVRICHYFANQTILDLSEGASRVHIVDYGILYGLQWPCLIKAFSARPGGPPHLRITGIDFPQPGFKPAERIEETGRRLADYAKQMGVPFEFHAVATMKWEGVQPSTLFLRHDEVLVVNSTFRLRHLLDESVMVDSPRKIVLSRIRSMRPKVFIQSVLNANYNAPFFMSRFREALAHYTSVFEGIDTAVSPEYPERHLIEQSIMGREILNIVACEGQERVERAESYKQWQSRTLKAGFEQLPLRPEIYSKARAMLSTYHKGFGIGQDGEWLLIGWKERILHAMCTWRVR